MNRTVRLPLAPNAHGRAPAPAEWPLEEAGARGSVDRTSAPGAASSPVPWFHVVPGARPLVLTVDRSRVFEVDAEWAARLRAGDAQAEAELRAFVPEPLPPFEVTPAPPVALSLNVAHACNLACHYCYADEGRFAGPAQQMEEPTAFTAIDRLFAEAGGGRVTIGFIGGEPLLHRKLVHRAVDHAVKRARETQTAVGFSLTTNGTLVREDDVALFRAHAFTVSVSLDGDAETHDRHRPSARGGGSHARALAALGPLLAHPGRARVVARATVTRDDLRIAERIEPLLAAGFAEAGVSPARTGPDASLCLRSQDWEPLLASMIVAARRELARLATAGSGRLRFSNLAEALFAIHRGSARPLPCGAGKNYVSLGADGRYFTCHRTVGQSSFALGDVRGGLDEGARRRFLQERAVDRQEPCRTCWARYLCGGGCHAEVAAAGRDGCDYVRGWLEFCLATYGDLAEERPDLFADALSSGTRAS